MWRTNGARRVTRGKAGASIVGKGHRGRARGRTTSKAVEFVKCSRAVKKSLFPTFFSTDVRQKGEAWLAAGSLYE